jgi:hypothetical protein
MPVNIREIPSQPGYWITSDGRVFKEKFPAVGANGYRATGFRRGEKTRYVHDLVAETYIGPKPEGMTVSHLDHNKTNNAAENLKYESLGDNIRRSSFKVCGENQGKAKLTKKQVKEIKNAEYTGYGFDTRMAERYGVSPSSIRGIRVGETWRHV